MPVVVVAQELGGEVAQRADHARAAPARSCAAGSPSSSGSRTAAGRGCRGGRHIEVFCDEHVLAREPDLAQQRVEQPPGLADERQALLVLVGPGASPTNIRSASALPAPKTTVFRVAASCGQRVQSRASSSTRLELLAALVCGHGPILDRTAAHNRSDPAPCGYVGDAAVRCRQPFATGIPQGSWTEIRDDTASPPLRGRGPGPDGLGARIRPARCRPRGHRPARPRRALPRRKPTASCSACRTPRSRTRPRAIAPGPLVGHVLRRHDARAARAATRRSACIR